MSNETMSAGQLLKQANQLKRVGKLDEAIALYHQVIDINPNFAWAYNNLGDAFVKQGKLDEAVAFCSESLKNNSNSAWLYYCLGEALAKQGDLEAALKYLQKAIDTKPNFYKFYHSLGQVLTVKGDFDEAIANYKKAIELNSKIAHSYVGCCFSYMCKGELSLAQDYLIQALKTYPNNSKIQLYNDFFKILEKLVAALKLKKVKNIFNTINKHCNNENKNEDCNPNFRDLLKLVKMYEQASVKADLMMSKLDKFHHCITEVVLPGVHYIEILKNLHLFLEPATYVEIGVQRGESFKLANSSTISIGIDPQPQLTYQIPDSSKVFSLTSDEFFQNYNLLKELKGHRIDFAFVDGLHLFEQALKDFINIEKYSKKNTVVCFHDTLPLDEITSRRKRVTRFWSGDVWKIVPILKQYRPNLDIFTIPTKPTGLTIIGHLNPDSQVLSKNYDEIVDQYMKQQWLDKDELRYAMLSVVGNSWNEIVKRLKWVKNCNY
jgi:tetratricopeptide (TPR) repeat protein